MLRELKDRRKPKLPPLFALARGIKNDKPASVGSMILSAPKGGMAGATGVPLAVGVLLLEKNKINKKGVFSTEAAIDPNDFFKELAPHCSPRKNDIHDLVLTTCSWEDYEVFDLLSGIPRDYRSQI